MNCWHERPTYRLNRVTKCPRISLVASPGSARPHRHQRKKSRAFGQAGADSIAETFCRGVMRPLGDIPASVRAGIRYVLTDIDDTLTTDGRLSAAAYAALERLANAGYRLIPVTGRPAGWCDLIARFWPIDAVIGENGAFYFR